MELALKILAHLSTTTVREKDIGSVEQVYLDATVDLQEGSSRTYRVANGASNQAIDLSGLSSCGFVFLRSDKDVTLRLNGTEDIALKKYAGLAYAYCLITLDAITSLDLSNASGAVATVKVLMAGETS